MLRLMDVIERAPAARTVRAGGWRIAWLVAAKAKKGIQSLPNKGCEGVQQGRKKKRKNPLHKPKCSKGASKAQKKKKQTKKR